MLCLLHVVFWDSSFAIACSLAKVKVSWLACQHAALNEMTTDCKDGMFSRPVGETLRLHCTA